LKSIIFKYIVYRNYNSFQDRNLSWDAKKAQKKVAGNNMAMTPELFEDICTMIESSSIGIPHLCKQVGIGSDTFYKYMRETLDAQKRYARAKEIQCEYLADEILEIADDATNDFMTVVKGDEEYERENKEVTNRSRLRVDSRKWLLSKLVPKKFGDKVDIEHSGSIDFASIIEQARNRINQKDQGDETC
jgi:hypothetical protein